MIGLTTLELYNTLFNKNTTKNNFFKKFEIYTDTFDEFLLKELKDELEQILQISHIIPYHLQHEIIGPRIIEGYRKLRLENSSTDGYIIFLLGYA